MKTWRSNRPSDSSQEEQSDNWAVLEKYRLSKPFFLYVGRLEEKKNLLETAYRDLEALDTVKNQLINRLSLDLRTPVTSLFTAARIMSREHNVPPEKADRLLTISEDMARDLTRDLGLRAERVRTTF